jgi:short-subunit dehydrogenase
MKPYGIKVVTLCPGYIDTPMTRVNPYPMPFLMAPERFAAQTVRAIAAGSSYKVIPWQMGVVAKVLRALPNAVYDFAFGKAPHKPRTSAAVETAAPPGPATPP